MLLDIILRETLKTILIVLFFLLPSVTVRRLYKGLLLSMESEIENVGEESKDIPSKGNEPPLRCLSDWTRVTFVILCPNLPNLKG